MVNDTEPSQAKTAKASQRLDNYQYAFNSKNNGECEVILRQRETATEGSKRREREELSQESALARLTA